MHLCGAIFYQNPSPERPTPKRAAFGWVLRELGGRFHAMLELGPARTCLKRSGVAHKTASLR